MTSGPHDPHDGGAWGTPPWTGGASPQYGSAAPWYPTGPVGVEPERGAPAPRPRVVVLGLAAWAVLLLVQLAAGIWSLVDVDEGVDAVLRQTGSDTVVVPRDLLHGFAVAGVVVGFVWIAVQVLFVWYAWQGRNWSRVVLWVLGGLAVLSAVAVPLLTSVVPTTAATSSGQLALTVVEGLLALAGVVLLALAPANAWFRRCGWVRAAERWR